MSATWSHGRQPMTPSVQRGTNPPPVCFKCGVEGHFVINCPNSQGHTSSSFVPPPPNFQQFPPGPTPWPAQAGPPPNQYSSYPPPQQFGPQAPSTQYGYNQPPQQYVPQPVVPQHNRPPYQPPSAPYAAPVGPPQFQTQGYTASQQSYGPPVIPAYQENSGSYPQNPPHSGNSQTPRRSFSANYPTPTPQQTGARPVISRQQRSNSGYQREYSGTPSQQSQRQRSQSSQPPLQSQEVRQEVPPQGQQPDKTPKPPTATIDTREQGTSHVRRTFSGNLESKTTSVTSTPQSFIKSPTAIQTIEAKQNASQKDQAEDGGMKEKEQEDKPEEGEVGPEDDEEEAFQWDYKHAFEQIVPKETVALAQPLSASFKTTPVPLMQTWSTKVPSISRYARHDNANEYIRSIRNSPQWSYLQEDPAFANADMEGELVSFHDVRAWMAAHHSMMHNSEPESDKRNSRKRPREEEEQEEQEEASSFADTDERDIEHQIAQEVAEGSEGSDDEGPQSKRLRQDIVDDANDDDVMEEVRSVGTPGTMIVIANARGGTPTLANIDDAWAPEPGERAASPPDPTEVLLASLGVSGDAKPIKQNDGHSHMGVAEEPHPRPASQTPVAGHPKIAISSANMLQSQPPPMNQSISLPNSQPSNKMQPVINASQMNGSAMNGPPITSMNNSIANGPPVHQSPMNGPPNSNNQMNMGHSMPPGPQGQYGPPQNAGYNGVPHMQQLYQQGSPANVAYPPNSQYGPPVNGVYSGGLPAQVPYVQPAPYGPPMNGPYPNAPNTYPQAPQQYGPPQNQAYGNGTPVTGPNGYNQYGPPALYPAGPPQAVPYFQPQFGPPPVNQQYGNPAVNYQQTPQYGPPQNVMYGSQPQPGFYSQNTQVSPAQYGPSQPPQYPSNPYPNQHFSNGPNPQFHTASQNGFQYPVGTPAQMLPNNMSNGNVPFGQDSGYANQGGSFNGDPNQNAYNGQNGTPTTQIQPDVNGFTQQANQNSAPKADSQQNQQTHSTFAHNAANDNIQNHQGACDSKEAQSSPVPHVPSTTATTRDSVEETIEKDQEGKKKRKKKEAKESSLTDLERELLGELDSTPTRRNPSRKAAVKKPQPVVEAAYSRRW